MQQCSHVLVVGIGQYIFIVGDALWVGERVWGLGVLGVIVSPKLSKSTLIPEHIFFSQKTSFCPCFD